VPNRATDDGDVVVQGQKKHFERAFVAPISARSVQIVGTSPFAESYMRTGTHPEISLCLPNPHRFGHSRPCILGSWGNIAITLGDMNPMSPI
jgi:hypothetical protein